LRGTTSVALFAFTTVLRAFRRLMIPASYLDREASFLACEVTLASDPSPIQFSNPVGPLPVRPINHRQEREYTIQGRTQELFSTIFGVYFLANLRSRWPGLAWVLLSARARAVKKTVSPSDPTLASHLFA